jgi:hypothetical protein
MMLVSSFAHSSYFVDTPDRSIDEIMSGCFSDHDCGLQAEKLIPLFAKKRGMTPDKVKNVLNTCLSPDRNMSFCASYELFALRFELNTKVSLLVEAGGKSCERPLRNQISAWEKSVTNLCKKKAEKQTEGTWGINTYEIEIGCEIDSTKSILKNFETRVKCLP